MSRNMNMPDREWSKNMWARIAALIDGQGQAIAGAIKAVTFNGGNVPPDATGRVTLTETDPTVPAWAKASSKPTYTAQEVGALPSSTAIPSKTSDLTNDGDGDSPFATLDDIPATSAPDVSQATGVLRVENGGTSSTDKDSARHMLDAAGSLRYGYGQFLNERELYLALVSDVSIEDAPRNIDMDGTITYLLTGHKCSGRFNGIIKYVYEAGGSIPNPRYPFVYFGMLTYSHAYMEIIYGLSIFVPEGTGASVTASVYQVTGTAL